MKGHRQFKFSWTVFIVFFGLVSLLWAGLSLDPRLLPSSMISKPFPSFSLPNLNAQTDLVQTNDLKGKVGMVHIWATWCGICLQEHDALMEISKKSSFPMYGILYQDDPRDGRRWLQQNGDPYDLSILDQRGRLGLDLGVYGTPETFVIDAKGIIRYRAVGAMTMRRFEKELLPILTELKAGKR